MNRRSFLTGLIAAPVVIRTAGLLMPIKQLIQPEEFMGDMIYNRSLDINDCLGWICTKAGSPGTWVEINALVSGKPAGRSQPPRHGRIYRDASYRRIFEPRPGERMIRFA